MLELLHIENIAIIERADILFGRGFNALTGETGAGKSIVIDALGAVLGQRTSRELIRTGAEKAFVSATSARFRQICRDSPKTALRRRRTERFYCSASCTVTAKTSAAWADGQ